MVVVACGLALAVLSTSNRKPAASPPAPAASPAASGPARTPSPQEEALSQLARRKDGDPFAAGRPDAPVVLIEYADYQCPFCGQFTRDIEPELIKRYVDAGTLRIEWRNFPIFGKESEAAARAAYAAGLQGRFRQFHREVYSVDRKRNSGAFADDKLVAMAREADVPDLARFRRDLNSEAARDAVVADQAEGTQIGVPSTPAFLVNGRPILGAQPLETFVETIEQEAAKTAGTGTS
ncbi:protein-disulfide isomerase [Streptosporangium becharense]|uniref:Protein-disulfide isomerase n=2 Tax=Streptosporangium becharense TaxID=1816182 RepID=A0A7W9IA67_9ACTN|nr:thioredoxin domain-containing protein [Streptosporangium becharense]MBB2915324.1 protein-disulfide isomerase [Streptosporangium becharense]MBB5816978.1 protein-disulfide isomerase [Streptosporangium becharense]